MWHLKYLNRKWTKEYNCYDFVLDVYKDHFGVDLQDAESFDDVSVKDLQEGDIVLLENDSQVHAGIYVTDGYLLNLRKTSIGSELTHIDNFQSLGLRLSRCYRYAK
mgnify:CR=1 FL=1